ncbi:chitooligosaccharidolytic beta-N-acetylglucosaminidase [Orussus abietinus]|uniref:chitooligosaccharidolytic beta-N-acetylglucosaminidase n=1 Tax=Orussus abietinus TaxID=222816 RepID=UPI00062676E4|nr:chitooligosaccharidolytic beta-N-acetylglucosaminidase [Orussus abietinus]
MLFLSILFFAVELSSIRAEEFSSPWHYVCEAGLCKKLEITRNVTFPLSLGTCQLFCGEAGGLWPKPTGHLSLGNFVVQLNPDDIELHEIDPLSRAGTLLQRNVEILKKDIRTLGGKSVKAGGKGLIIHVAKTMDANDVKLTLNTTENYTLSINQLEDGKINASITTKTYFGARHALETLSQLIVFDDLRGEIQIVRDVYVVDGPVYPYRGILLDTSRNFMDKDSILRTIKAMSMSKLNTFHWHITDSHSFPYVSRTYPNMSKYGAYTPSKVYTQRDIQEVLEFGLLHGVRILPEFDAPAHVGEGWQWVGGNTILCFAGEPWKSLCVEPPCGQLNPSSEKVYEILEGIYRDMIKDFKPDLFHMGGDEVSVSCWRTSEDLSKWMINKGWNSSDSSYYKLWDYFQEKAYERLKKANDGKDIPAILWTSHLTDENNIQYLDPNTYIIQIWTDAKDSTIRRLIKNNFKMIFSNYDALYLDCGFGAWVGEGNNWCSPYKGWQTVYENSPLAISRQNGITPNQLHLILGGEAALWSEQVDSSSVDFKLWPRSAALGERLWSEPSSTWRHAEHRMLKHRERLVQKGIGADSLEPEWCAQNQGSCYA